MTDWNRGIIEEFRANHGKVGGRFEGRPLLLLHHRGAKTGTERVNPLAYQDLGDGAVAVFASKGGAPTNPDWYHNVRANPSVRVEIGDDTFDSIARVAEGDERERIWEERLPRVRRLRTDDGAFDPRGDRRAPLNLAASVHLHRGNPPAAGESLPSDATIDLARRRRRSPPSGRRGGG